MTSPVREPASAAGPPGLTLQHARAILAACIDLHAEHRAPRPAASMNTTSLPMFVAELHRKLGDFARGLVEPLARASSSSARIFASSASRLARFGGIRASACRPAALRGACATASGAQGQQTDTD